MIDWLLGLPVLWMSLVILGGVYLFTAAVYLVVMRLAIGDRARSFKAISPGMLPPLSVVFALLVGFLAAQVWSDTDRANGAVNREASALRGVVLLAAAFPGEPEHRLRELIRQHIQTAVSGEWPAMARGSATLAIVPRALADALRLALTLETTGGGQAAAQREIVSALQNALDARRQRIILSRSSINWVKWTALLLQAGLTLVIIGMVHSDNRTANRIILAIFATAVGVAAILIAGVAPGHAGGGGGHAGSLGGVGRTRTGVPQGSRATPPSALGSTATPPATTLASAAAASADVGRMSSHSSRRASRSVAGGAPAAHVFVPRWW